jgi:hypothetical protein
MVYLPNFFTLIYVHFQPKGLTEVCLSKNMTI